MTKRWMTVGLAAIMVATLPVNAAAAPSPEVEVSAQGAAVVAGMDAAARRNAERREEHKFQERFERETRSEKINLLTIDNPLEDDTVKKGFRYFVEHSEPFKFDQGPFFYRSKQQILYGGDAAKGTRTDSEYHMRIDGEVQPVLLTFVSVVDSDARDAQRVKLWEKEMRVFHDAEDRPEWYRVWEIVDFTKLNGVPEEGYEAYKKYLREHESKGKDPELTLGQFLKEKK